MIPYLRKCDPPIVHPVYRMNFVPVYQKNQPMKVHFDKQCYVVEIILNQSEYG